jgi:hypothetical protein
MKRQTCEFVSATDVFENCPLAWDVFSNSDPDCTWGDNNRSMVTPDVIYTQLDDIYDDDDEQSEVARQVKLVKLRLHDLGQTYIDLES